MTAFPDSPKPQAGTYVRGDEFLTIVGGPYEAGGYVSRPARPFPLFGVKLVYARHKTVDLSTLYEFFYAQKGRHGAFTFFDFNGWNSTPVGVKWPELFVATLDGVTTSFDLPMLGSSSIHVFVNGVEITSEIYTDSMDPGIASHVHVGGGTDGRDTILLQAAHTAGDILTYQATGRRACRASFGEDSMSFTDFVALTTESGLSIVERPVIG